LSSQQGDRIAASVNREAEFGLLLGRYRVAKGHTQEQLAERAELSVQAISALESGKRRAPQAATLDMLLKALELAPDDEKALVAAAGRARLRGPKGFGTAALHLATSPNPHNLPLQLTPLIGRRNEMEDVERRLADARMLTVVGPGGIGKTRVALSVAERQVSRWTDGVWFVDFAPLDHERSIVASVASALGLSLGTQEDPLDSLVNGLRGRTLLLLLDNCEHLAEAVAELATALLQRCPNLRVVATSQHVLGVPGESIYRTPPLSLPSPEQTHLTLAEAENYDAVALFLSHVRSAGGAAVSDEQAISIVEICRRLDGIALAIKLAAARVPTLGLEKVRERLDVRLRLLTRGVAGARQQTMRALIDWSHGLLDEREQTLFRRLAIFAAGWTLEAAEAVGAGEPVAEDDVLDVLTSLVEKSLVDPHIANTQPSLEPASRFADGVAGFPTRFRLLESTRAYGLERLAAAEEELALSRRHAAWMAAFADEAYERFWTVPTRAWLSDVLPELENVRAALAWSVASGEDIELGARVVSGLMPLWQARGPGEGRRWIEAFLEVLPADANARVRGRLWWSYAALSVAKRKVDAARQAGSAYAIAADQAGIAESLRFEAEGLRHMHQFVDAQDSIERALAIYGGTELRGTLRYPAALQTRGLILLDERRYEAARAAMQESLDRFTRLGDETLAASVAIQLAELHFALGDPVQAAALAESAVAMAGRPSDKAGAYCNAAAYDLALEKYADAREAARNAIRLAVREELAIYAMIATQHLASIAIHRGDARSGATLLAFVDRWYEQEGFKREHTEQTLYDSAIIVLPERLTSEEIARARERAADLTEDSAIAEALST